MLIAIPAPAFHLVLDTVQSGEVYNLIIRGGNEGGLDGIDVWGFNMHIHDVEVTNKDECVTVKESHFPNTFLSYLILCRIPAITCSSRISTAIGVVAARLDLLAQIQISPRSHTAIYTPGNPTRCL